MRASARHNRWLFIASGATLVTLALLVASALTTRTAAQAGGQSLSQLNSELGANTVTQSNLAADLTSLNHQITTLNGRISIIQARESSVQDALDTDRANLTKTRQKLGVEREHLTVLRAALRRALSILTAQLVSSYEQPQSSLVSVVLSAHGFSQMLDQIQDLKSAEYSQQQIITFTTRAKRAASTAADALAGLQHEQSVMTAAATIQVNALAGMNTVLTSQQHALSDIESARATALTDARARGNSLRSAIATIKAQQAAAARAAAAAAAAASAAAAAAAAHGSDGTDTSAPASAAPSGGWAIPAAVVMCESGGQNLPPNSAGASGYYQIMPATWAGEGGTGPAAYLAPEAEQSAIAAKLWNGGAGASNWVCAGIVGIT